MSGLHAMQTFEKGKLQINVLTAVGAEPIPDATVTISYTGNPSQTIEEVKTDESGQTEVLELNAPPLELSMEPSERQPYAEYTIVVTAPGYRPLDISGIAVLPDVTAVQPVNLRSHDVVGPEEENIVISANTLYGNFPPKIPEAEIKPVSETGEIVLSRVVVPEYVIVHDGAPTDSTAQEYYIRYRDYIKNVASSEIYATWPDASLRANILAIMSFTMNRVYTEWYRDIQKFWVKLQSWNM